MEINRRIKFFLLKLFFYYLFTKRETIIESVDYFIKYCLTLYNDLKLSSNKK